MEKKKLLIADGSDEFRFELGKTLQGSYHIRQTGEGHEALSQLRSFAPDILVLDLMLPGLDGISLLQSAAEFNIRPVVLATTRLLSGYMTQTLERLGVGYVMVKPCDTAAIAARIADLAQNLKTPLFVSPDPRSMISNVLLNMGVPTKLKGYTYLREAIQVFAEDPGQTITKELYSKVASRCNATVTQVERSIRTAIEAAWEHQDIQAWRRFFPEGENGLGCRPTNGEFVSRLADYLAAEMRSVE